MRNRISLAYCITTSGTTGSPKIVKVPDECIVPNINVYKKGAKHDISWDILF
jgi:long-subunit acyl-CoA synthetase (AMP-forming)